MKINWQGNRSDVTATVGDYTLRAEMIDRGIWWWRVHIDHNEVASVYDTEKWPKTRAEAQMLAEKAMNEHINKP